MKPTEVRIINFKDEEFFLKKKPKGKYKCIGCDNTFISGGTIVFGFRPSNRYRYCYKCLSKIETVMRKGRKAPFKKWGMSVNPIKAEAPCMLLGKDYKAAYKITLPQLTLKLSDEGYGLFYRELTHFNETQNKYIIVQKEKRKSLNTKLANKEQKMRIEAMHLVRWIKEQPLIDYYYSLGNNERSSFLKQMMGQNSYSEPTEIIRMGEPRDTKQCTLRVMPADPKVLCSIHPLKHKVKADFHIFEQGRQFQSLNITACKDCCKDLLNTLNLILSDQFLKKAEGQHTCVLRDAYEQECFYCGCNANIEIKWNNAIIYLCEDCANNFYSYLDKRLCKLLPERKLTPIRQKRYIHIEERMLTSKRTNSRAVYTVGSKMDDVRKTETEFIVRTDFYPCLSDNLGHTTPMPTKYYLCTNNPRIPFDLALSSGCAERLLSVLKDPNKRIVGYGKSLWMNDGTFRGNDHCIFCETSEGNNHRIHIGNIEISCCDKHLSLLIDTLKNLQ